ncbi:MAG: phenylalanine--tRNA ligase subunit alpha [Chromatiales bacterium]|nr:phenylalanine--tRNA ligase subunit alpha [Chromatiales bacterium]
MDFVQLQLQACSEIEKAQSLESLAQLRIAYLGKKGKLTQQLKELNTLSSDQRPTIGQQANLAKQEITKALVAREQALKEGVIAQRILKEKIDVGLAGRTSKVGNLHPITRTLRQIETLFTNLGFDIAEGPEIEDDFHNFEALNIPPSHPARAMHDTFYMKNGDLLRTHTSPVQIRVMQQRQPPIRIIAPGPVYRRDFDITHSPMFHQVEGLVVGADICFADLKGLVINFLRTFFEDEALAIRFRPSYFPFTEPSAEVDIAWREGKRRDWLEVMGCGMVHPAVFKAVGYDTDLYRGYAFGLGIERLAMLRYCIDDLRLLFENDLRFLKQFYL